MPQLRIDVRLSEAEVATQRCRLRRRAKHAGLPVLQPQAVSLQERGLQRDGRGAARRPGHK
eukprot:7047006-Pyramimonas_sp.AAC.1